MRKQTYLGALAIGLALLTTSCTTSDGEISDAPTSTAADQSEVANQGEGDGTVETEDAKQENPKFGQTFTYDDGLAITVSAPEEFKPSDYAAGHTEGLKAVKFTVTITNGTGANFDPTLLTTSVNSGGNEASAIYDDGVGDNPTTTLLPDKAVSVVVGYSVVDPADIVMDVSPDLEHGAVLFTS